MTEEVIMRTGGMEWGFVVRLKFEDVRNRSSARAKRGVREPRSLVREVGGPARAGYAQGGQRAGP
ncbi:MAG: hypothetical protein D6723_14410 [Acidobacteria bacterium]|nr:MAG: hypothetical protein D6723_14410 [Acidobacteriota bacterium]